MLFLQQSISCGTQWNHQLSPCLKLFACVALLNVKFEEQIILHPVKTLSDMLLELSCYAMRNGVFVAYVRSKDPDRPVKIQTDQALLNT